MQQLWGKLDKYHEKKSTVLLNRQKTCHQLQVAGEWESMSRHSHIGLALPDGGCSWGLQDIGLQYYKRRGILFLYNSILCISLKT